tara:strand:+ start:200 stop:433 length:234 start_codon:yes stop_codon:yes gene_type:complete
MDSQTAISRAAEQLMDDREGHLKAMLLREGFVRILPRQDVTSTPADGSEMSPDYSVTFTQEGRRLIAEFQGAKEFVT